MYFYEYKYMYLGKEESKKKKKKKKMGKKRQKLQWEQFVKTGFLSIVSIKLLGGSLYVNRV